MRFVLALLTLVFAPAMADDDHNYHDGGSTDTIVDTVIGGDSSKALGLGFNYALSDVDLNEGRNCYVSTARGNILYGSQKVGLNPWCAALFYDANRKHVRAAAMRCSIDDVIATHPYYGDPDKCIAGETLAPFEIVTSPVIEEFVQLKKAEEEHDEKLEYLQQQMDTLTKASQRVAQSAPRSLLSSKQRIALEGILNEESN